MKAKATSEFGAFVVPMEQKGDDFGGDFLGLVHQSLDLSRKHL